MADIPKEKQGDELADRVDLTLGGEMVVRVEEYAVQCAVIQQPATFTARISPGTLRAGAVVAKYPPGTQFELKIAGNRQFIGRIDGWTVSGPSGSTSLEMKGRDMLAALHDNDVSAEISFTNITYSDLVREAMKACGVDRFPLVLSNDENRIIKSGAKVTTAKGASNGPTSAPPPRAGQPKLSKADAEFAALQRDVTFVSLGAFGGAAARPTTTASQTASSVADQRVQSGTGQGVRHIVHAKLGESWLDFVVRHLAKVGLFIWTGQDGSFIVARPGKVQTPACLFVRQRGQRSNVCNVTDARWTNDTTNRFSTVTIYARGLGRKHGRSKIHDGHSDEEMIEYGFKKEKVYRDVNVTNAEQAEFYAKRRIAEANRNAWRLIYTFSGHTAPTLTPGDRSIPIPDIVARVKDDEFGLYGDFYIESVQFLSPPRTTTVTMMRLEDLFFDEDAPAPKTTGVMATKLKGTTPSAAVNELDALGLRVGTYGIAGIVPPGSEVPTPRPLPTANPKLQSESVLTRFRRTIRQ